MIYHDTDARALFARERAQLLASEMGSRRTSTSQQRQRRLQTLLAYLIHRRRERQYEAPAYEG
jgi:hypothetical protein